MESPFKADALEGKVVLITGGGSGIGFELSAQLGNHGAYVAVMGRCQHILDNAVVVLESLGVSAVGFAGDVRKQEDARRVVEATVGHFGKLDVLVNGAAGNFLAPAEDLSPNGFKTVMDIDTIGTFTMCYEALKYLKKNAPGRINKNGISPTGGLILNITATSHYTACRNQIHMSAAKAAIDALTRNLALEWGSDHGIRVNGIAPGLIDDTPGTRKILPGVAKDNFVESLPLRKLGQKWDVAMAAIYVASDAGKYINGTVLVVDGGMWLSIPPQMSKEAIRQVSRAIEKRSREAPTGIPSSKL